MSTLGQDGLIDHIIERAYEVYRQKEEMISQPLYEVIKNIQKSDEENRPEKVQIVFTDGIRRMRVVVDVERAMENKGHEVARALERTAVLSTIDDKWMNHLRELDAVKEGIGLRAFGQKDPLLEYKREAFEMFKQLLDEINQEAISLIWKAIPEMQADQQKLQKAQKERAKIDMNRAKTQHSDATNMGFKAGAQQSQNGGQQQRSDQKPQPVTVDEEPGRNDYVKIQNMGSGEVIDIKWKKAKRMIEEDSWVLIEK
jgi:preprotein translocase subunit SecA